MKYNTPKEFWNLYKELKAFKQKKADEARMDDIVLETFKKHLGDRNIRYQVRHPDNLIEWSAGFDDERNGILFYFKDGSDYILDCYCYVLGEADQPLDYVRFSNVFNSLLTKGNVYYYSDRKVLRYRKTVSIREIFWEPALLDEHLFRHYAIADDISRCAHEMHNSGKDPFDVVADFMSSRQSENAN